MESLLKFFKKIHFLLLFLVLEAIALSFAINGDVRRKSLITTSANRISGSIYSLSRTYVGYFNLRKENELLTKELARLKNKEASSFIIDTAGFKYCDTCITCKYRYLPASVLKNSINKSYNFITLNEGSDAGVRTDMGVVCASGVVGTVVSVSKNFSLVLSLLNKTTGVSAKLKHCDFYGVVTWPGEDYRVAVLNEIPNHISLSKGDTIVTSGYSAIFPEGILVGRVKAFEKNSDNNFYKIIVDISTDFKCLSNVLIIDNIQQKEQRLLEAEESKIIP